MSALFPEDGNSFVVPIEMEKKGDVWQKKERKIRHEPTYFIYDEVAPVDYQMFAWTLGIPMLRRGHSGVVFAVADCAPGGTDVVAGEPDTRLTVTGRTPTEPAIQRIDRKRSE